jgi:AcrR family transcriptional regulator
MVRELRSRRAEIEEEIFARVSDRWFDQTGTDDPEYMVGLRAAGAASLDYVLAGVERWGEFLAPVPSAVLEQARRAARAGAGLETVLRRYSAGHAVLADFVVQQAEHGALRGHEPELRKVLARVAALVDRLTTAVSGVYNKEWQRIADGVGSAENKEVPDRRQPRSAEVEPGSRIEPALTRGAAGGSQRERVLTAIAEVVAERGYARSSVALITKRARVSSRTFYQLFADLDTGVVAVRERAFERVVAVASVRVEEGETWQDGVRGALSALLVFFDSEPELARVCFVETIAAGPAVLRHREQVAESFRGLLLTRIAREVEHMPPMAENIVASVIGAIFLHLVNRQPEPLIGLLGQMMGAFVTPFLVDEKAVAEEARRGEELARTIQADASSSGPRPHSARGGPGISLPSGLANPSARRLRECLLYLADNPGTSNREIGEGIGVVHKSQASRLLTQLSGEGFIAKRSEGVGTRNQWQLTSRGKTVAQALARHVEFEQRQTQ